MRGVDDTQDLKEIRELLRSLLAPRSLEEEVGLVQGRDLGSRRKPNHGPSRGAGAAWVGR
jgi:hypothetical protein